MIFYRSTWCCMHMQDGEKVITLALTHANTVATRNFKIVISNSRYMELRIFTMLIFIKGQFMGSKLSFKLPLSQGSMFLLQLFPCGPSDFWVSISALRNCYFRNKFDMLTFITQFCPYRIPLHVGFKQGFKLVFPFCPQFSSVP